MIGELLVGGKTYTRDWLLLDHYPEGQAVLAKAYDQDGARLECLCKTPGIEMYIRKCQTRYSIVRMPGGGPSHHPACPSFDFETGSEERDGLPAIQGHDDGTVSVHLSSPLSRRSAPIADQPPDGVRHAGKSQNTLTLLGFLHYLWGEAGLNQWSPNFTGHRNWAMVRRRVLQVASKVRSGHGVLADTLLVPELFDKARADDRVVEYSERILQACGGDRSRYLMLIAPLSEFQQSKYGYRAVFTHMSGLAFWMNAEANNFVNSFNRELASLGSGDKMRLVAVFTVEVLKTGNFRLVEGGLMRTNHQYIPVDSRYEAIIADSLVENKRAFSKPLNSHARADGMLPDFILLDCDLPVPMEIFGVSGNGAYDKRKKEKIALYRANNEQFWSWDPQLTGSGVWPEFPPAKK